MVDSAFLEWDKACMSANLQQLGLRDMNTARRAAVTQRSVPMIAKCALLLGLLIIPTLSGVALFA